MTQEQIKLEPFPKDAKKHRFTLEQAMKFAGVKYREPRTETIGFDKQVKPQFSLVYETSHDGTRLFTMELVRDALFELGSGQIFYPPIGKCPSGKRIFYTVGQFKLLTWSGSVRLPAGRHFGQRERLSIPVHCAYVDR